MEDDDYEGVGFGEEALEEDEPDDLLVVAGEVAANYPLGAYPGEHPIEILTGLHRGLTLSQLDAITASPELLQMVRQFAGDRPSERLIEISTQETELGRAHRSLLATLRQPHLTLPGDVRPDRPLGTDDAGEAQVEASAWLWLAAEVQPEECGSEPHWMLDDPRLQAQISLTLAEGCYEVSLVAVTHTLPVELLLLWETGEIEVYPASPESVSAAPVRARAFGRRLAGIQLR